jgi:hypothetical protein
MDKTTSGTIELTCDSESRLTFIRFKSETHATSKDAVVLVDESRARSSLREVGIVA